MTFQSDNGTALVGELTKELMRRSQVAQAHSTTYHPQTKNLEPDLPFTIQTRQKDGTRPRKNYNPYGDDFVVDRIDMKKIVEEVVGLEEITVSQSHDDEWVDNWSKPEVEFDDEQ